MASSPRGRTDPPIAACHGRFHAEPSFRYDDGSRDRFARPTFPSIDTYIWVRDGEESALHTTNSKGRICGVSLKENEIADKSR